MWDLNQTWGFVTLSLSLLIFGVVVPRSCDSLPVQSQLVSSNNNHWQAVVRDAIKLWQKQRKHPYQNEEGDHHDSKLKVRFVVDPKEYGITTGSGDFSPSGGLVKHRNIRSGIGEMEDVVRMMQLHELERAWAGKARPRFGKRAEVSQDSFLPPYPTEEREYYDHGLPLEFKGSMSELDEGRVPVPIEDWNYYTGPGSK